VLVSQSSQPDSKTTHKVHDDTCGDADRNPFQSVLDHKARSDLVHAQGLQSILEGTKPLEPAEDRGDAVEMNEETSERHLVQGCEGTDESCDSAIFKYDGQQEVLPAERGCEVRSPGANFGTLTQSVITRVYKTMINKNLKKFAASPANPAIQYTLNYDQQISNER